MVNLRKEWLPAAILLLTAFLFFTPVLKHDFVNWDDDVNVYENRNVAALNAESIKGMFSQTIIGGYTPLTTLSFAVENSLFGMKPGVFHLNNLLLHMLCTLLIYLFFRKLEFSVFISLVTALLFGIHPMRVESVAWITERKDVLYAFFFLLSAIAYLVFYKKRSRLWYGLSLVAFALALLSKIQAVSLPLVLLLIDFRFEKRFTLKQLSGKAPFFLLSLATGIAGIYLLGQEGSLDTGQSFPILQRIFIGTYTLCVYLVKSVVPYQLSAIYPYPEKLGLLFYLSILPLAGIALLIWKARKYRTELTFGVLLFVVNVLFVLQVVGAGQAFLADRFTYLAYAGLFFLIAWGLNFLFESKRKNVAIAVVVVFAGLMGGLTWQRTRVWQNSETLFLDVIEKYPQTHLAWNNLGSWYRDQKRSNEAIAAYTKSISVQPGSYTSYSNRGEAWFERGEIDKALDDMNEALKINPDYTKALSNRGAILGMKQEFDLALADLNRAIQIDPRNAKALLNRSLAHYSTGNFEQAIFDATAFLDLNPDDPDILNHRGLCFDQLNRSPDAVKDFTRAIRLKPRQGGFYQNRSYALAKMGDAKGALADILKAQELGVKINQAYLERLRQNQ